MRINEELIKMLRARLADTNVDNYLFKDEQLEKFIELGKSAVSQLSISNGGTDNTFLIVQYAAIQAMSAKALEERGREFRIKDSDVSFQPPSVSDMLLQQCHLETTLWLNNTKQ